jgi:hypothetical protein
MQGVATAMILQDGIKSKLRLFNKENTPNFNGI